MAAAFVLFCSIVLFADMFPNWEMFPVKNQIDLMG